MTLDEAIKHCEDIVKSNTVGVYDSIALGGMHFTQEEIDECNKCAEEHRQLAEWLKELKVYKEQDKAVAEAIEQGVVWDSEQHNWLEQIKKHTQNFSNFTSSACRMCSNNPINGGSGICHCILGISPIS